MYQMVRLLLIGVCLLLGASAQAGRRSSGHPDEDPAAEEARVHLKAGVIYFNSGRYEDAAREMTEAFRKKPVPELQYNLAQCYERMGSMQKAVDAYRLYLERLPAAADRAEVEKRLAELRARPAAPAVPATDGQRPPAEEPPPTLSLVPPPPPAEKVVFKEIVVYRDAPPKAGRGSRIAAAALGGLAIVGLAAAIGFGATGSAIDKTIREQGPKSPIVNPMEENKCPPPGMPPPADDMGKGEICFYFGLADQAVKASFVASAVGGAVFVGAGAAALGLFLHGRKLDRRQAEDLKRKGELSLLPVLDRGGGGMVLTGTF